ncbi:MAG: S8 family serine peptidase [Bacteriovoracaceae bacterium]|nr:S8 family serine peptidase [Bacteriovoracaceae bacterium]
MKLKKLLTLILLSINALATDVDLEGHQWFLDNNSPGSIMVPDNIKLEKTPIVAVFDFGVDYDHPELSHSIHRNEVECSGVQGKDDDNNGYIDDCYGVNLSDSSNNIKDLNGHGTHVSGIISALNDGRGIRGVDDRIKILPVRIFNGSSRPFRVKPGHPFSVTSIIEKGIDYAIKRKVDVINISAGWLNKMHSTKIEQAIIRANDAGIIVVSAAGNNMNSSNQYPCSLEGVLCVGAIGKSGTISDFSNFGGMVDIYAPGEEIVSTIPTDNYSTNLTISGYDKLDGSSQSAPFVSAAIALLKGNNPTLSNAEVIQRILDGSTTVKGDLTEYRFLNIKRALSIRANPSIYPVLKKNSTIALNKNLEFSLRLPIQSLGNKSSAFKLECSSLSQSFTDLSCISLKDRLNPFEKSEFILKGKLKDSKQDNLINIDFSITQDGKEKRFRKSFYLVKNFNKQDLISFKLPTEIPSINNMQPVKTYGYKDSSLFFSMVKRQDGVEVIFYKFQGTSFKQTGSFLMQNLLSVYNIVSVQSHGRQENIIVYSTQGDVDTKILKAAYFDSKFGQHLSTLEAKINTNTKIDTSKITFIKAEDKLLVGYLTTSFLDQKDFDATTWGKTYLDINFQHRDIGKHLFYIAEDGFRAFDNEQFYQDLYTQLNLNWIDKTWFNASPIDFDGVPTYQLSIEQNGNITGYIVVPSINSPLELEPLSNDYFDINNTNAIRVENFNFMNNKKNTLVAKVNGEHIINLFDYMTEQGLQFRQENTSEKIQSVVGGVFVDNEQVIFYETKKHLIAFNTRDLSVKHKVQIDRLNYFQNIQESLTDLYNPGATYFDGKDRASVFMDFSHINSNFVSTAVVTDNTMIRPVELSFRIPNNCKTQNVIELEQKKYLPLTCLEGDVEKQFLKAI